MKNGPGVYPLILWGFSIAASDAPAVENEGNVYHITLGAQKGAELNLHAGCRW